MLNILTLLALYVSNGFAQFPAGTTVDKVSGSTIFFKIPEGKTGTDKIDTKFFEPQVLAFMRSSDLPDSVESKFVLVSAMPCKGCGEPKNLYLFRGDKKQRYYQFVYPGKIIDLKSRAVVYDSRAFFGRCLPDSFAGSKEVYVAFQREHVDRRRGYQSSVFVAVPSETFLKERLIENRPPKIQVTLNYMKKKQCFEVPGITRMTSNKKIDLRPKSKDVDEDSDDEKEEEKVDEKAGEKPESGKTDIPNAMEPMPSSDRDN